MTDAISKKMARTCDACKARKVRCVRFDDETQSACRNCTTRNTPCHYSYLKRPRKRKVIYDDGSSPAILLSKAGDISTSHPPTSPGQSTPGQDHERPNLYFTPKDDGKGHQALSQLQIDLLLADRQTPTTLKIETSSTKLTEFFGPNSNLSFFSSSRVRSLNNRLGHTKLDQLVQRIDSVITNKMSKRPSSMTCLYSLRQSKRPTPPGSLMASYVKSYFDQVHPIYPFLDRHDFEKKAFQLSSHSPANKDEAWSALYYSVLAIGCQYHGGGSFDPGFGTAWQLFEVSISYFPDIVMMKGSLVAVQALTAMAIFSTTVPAYPFESVLVMEAAKLCQSMGYNKTTSTIPNPNEDARCRTFWVVYCMEKTTCFVTGRTSIIMDSDIGCPIPLVPESIFGEYDWFLSLARYSRLISRIYESLFTVSSGEASTDTYHVSIEQLKKELEAWRVSIPLQYRPREHFSGRGLPGTLEIYIAVTTQYLYFNALLTLLRISLYIKAGDVGTAPNMQETKKQLMETVCLMLDLTKYIEVAAYTPLWTLALMPISALFILFDLVIHNPTHPETNNNLALLDVASGHFSRIEYASRGTLPGSLVSEFVHIARDFVRDAHAEELDGDGGKIARNAQNNNLEMTSTHSIPTGAAALDTSTNVTFDPKVASSTSLSSPHGQFIPGITEATTHQMKASSLVPVPISPVQQQHQQSSHAYFGHDRASFAMSNHPLSTTTAARPGTSTEPIFFPLVDDPTYAIQRDDGELQQFFGIDVMDLFDHTIPSNWGG